MKYLFLFILVGCLGLTDPRDGGGNTRLVSTGQNGSGQGAVGIDESALDDNILPTLIEIRHLVDPFNGAYKKKLTLPKNYRGYLYLSGINISLLRDRLVHVRFRFGQDLTSIVIPATVATGPGLTDSTDIEVLVLDLDLANVSENFDQVALLYDLFDYNDYSNGATPTQDPRNNQLFCRGLNLEHDSTLESEVERCQGEDETCLYAFAKVRDAGLVHPNTGVMNFPSELQISPPGLSVQNLPHDEQLKLCLPDNGVLTYSGPEGSRTFNFLSNDRVIAGLGQGVLTYGGIDYQYQGPYTLLDTTNGREWEIKGEAVYGEKGIFLNSFDGSQTLENNYPVAGVHSKLFPLATKLDLGAGTSHLGSNDWLVQPPLQRNVVLLPSGGETQWMDGCNRRIQTYNPINAENISSCNVSATIEVIQAATAGNSEVVIASTNDVKLQLTRQSELNASNEEVLVDSFNACSSSSSCATGECCFNGRCWSDDLISSCPADGQALGNQNNGTGCGSDFECSSLCCQGGACQPHNPSQELFCAKPVGAFCISSEFCAVNPDYRECFIVRTNTDDGAQSCELRCFSVPRNGDCVNGLCQIVESPTAPEFDPENPDCTNAVDLPF